MVAMMAMVESIPGKAPKKRRHTPATCAVSRQKTMAKSVQCGRSTVRMMHTLTARRKDSSSGMEKAKYKHLCEEVRRIST